MSLLLRSSMTWSERWMKLLGEKPNKSNPVHEPSNFQGIWHENLSLFGDTTCSTPPWFGTFCINKKKSSFIQRNISEMDRHEVWYRHVATRRWVLLLCDNDLWLWMKCLSGYWIYWHLPLRIHRNNLAHLFSLRTNICVKLGFYTDH